MAETPIVAVDTDTDKELELDLTPDGTEDIEQLREKLTKAEKAKKDLHGRAKRAEAEAKELKDKLPKAPESPSSISSPSGGLNEEVVDLRLAGYTKQQVEFIMKNGGSKALEDKNSLVSVAINAQRDQAKAEAEANKVTDTSGMTEVEKKYTPEQLAAMSAAELKKILPHT